ncbi:MAG: hypothetical protein ACFFA7_14270 [Promethearchaeota archaeon]
MRKVDFVILLSLISWPIISFLFFILIIRSNNFHISIVISISFGAFPFILAICLFYNYYRHFNREEGYRDTKIQIIIPEFSNIKDLLNEIKEKQSELDTLKKHRFKSFIVDIQKKSLKKELKLLKKMLLKMKKTHS